METPVRGRLDVSGRGVQNRRWGSGSGRKVLVCCGDMISTLRRGALFVLVLAPCFSAVAVLAQMQVTLVGTGGPELTAERQGEATLVQVQGQTLLFDAGRGVLDGLYRARVAPGGVTRVFLTHLHSDHIEGLPGLWMTPWFLLGRTTPMEIWGPAGTRAMVDGMRQMYGHDVMARVNPTAKAEGLAVTVHEIAPGVVYDEGGVQVTAIAVEHADGDPAFAFARDRSMPCPRQVAAESFRPTDSTMLLSLTNAGVELKLPHHRQY